MGRRDGGMPRVDVPDEADRDYVGVTTYTDPSGNVSIDRISYRVPPHFVELQVMSASEVSEPPLPGRPRVRRWVVAIGSQRARRALFWEGGRWFVRKPSSARSLPQD